MKKALLEVDSLSVFYENKDFPILRDISFSLNENEKIALIGLNGSGKTTLLLSIVAIVEYKGIIRFKGKPVSTSNIKEIREKTGFLFSTPDDQILFPTVLEDISFALVKRGLSEKEALIKVQKIATELGIEKHLNSYSFELSYGERLKVALSGLLAAEPELLLLDEPTSGLDPVGKKRLKDILSKVSSAQIIATHDIGFASDICSRYILLEDGRLSKEGSDFSEISEYWKEKGC